MTQVTMLAKEFEEYTYRSRHIRKVDRAPIRIPSVIPSRPQQVSYGIPMNTKEMHVLDLLHLGQLISAESNQRGRRQSSQSTSQPRLQRSKYL